MLQTKQRLFETRAAIACAAAVALSVTIGFTDRAAMAAQPKAPIFDAHLHYNGDAEVHRSPARTVALLENAGVAAIIANSTPNESTWRLASAAQSGSLVVVPFLRPYRTDADRARWFDDPAVRAFIDAELAREPRYRGIGEFHVHGAADATGATLRHVIDIAVARDLWLLAHCDDAALEAMLAHDPRVKVIWAHAGFTTPTAKIADYLARYPQLRVELSYRNDIASAGRVAPAWRELLVRHSDRFLVGGDTWTDERWSRYDAIIGDYRRWLGDLPQDVAQNIRWNNGARLFGIATRGTAPSIGDRLK